VRDVKQGYLAIEALCEMIDKAHDILQIAIGRDETLHNRQRDKRNRDGFLTRCEERSSDPLPAGWIVAAPLNQHCVASKKDAAQAPTSSFSLLSRRKRKSIKLTIRRAHFEILLTYWITIPVQFQDGDHAT
jgi:hypothetical protein